jgi:hypothetical protein
MPRRVERWFHFEDESDLEDVLQLWRAADAHDPERADAVGQRK